MPIHSLAEVEVTGNRFAFSTLPFISYYYLTTSSLSMYCKTCAEKFMSFDCDTRRLTAFWRKPTTCIIVWIKPV